MCAVCGTWFTGRADAVYCSSACRQKAHRARIAHRVAAVSSKRSDTDRDEVRRRPVAIRSDIAQSIARAREQVAVSRRLCRDSAERLQRLEDLQRELAEPREVWATTPMSYAKWAR
ncbi:Uncharacterised protein [Mycolicibacterium smegmatis]|nr:Uncharacterised protein [Mycolicibacterium smegmatis]